MTIDLDAVQQLPGLPDLAEREAARAVASGPRDAKAGTIRRVYGSAWQQFLAWAKAGGHPALPTTPQSVALYLGHLAAEDKVMAAGLPLPRRRRHAEGRQPRPLPSGGRSRQGLEKCSAGTPAE